MSQINLGATSARPWLAAVNGRPAVAFCDSGMIKFIRASDADGDTWGTAVNIDTGNDDVTLLIANGRPAICWYRDSPAC